MQEYLVIHRSDWRCRPTAAQMEACVSLLIREGIVGAPISGKESAFLGGPHLQEKLGLAGEPHVSQIDIWASEDLMVSVGPMDVNCPQCGAEVEEWGRPLQRVLRERL